MIPELEAVRLFDEATALARDETLPDDERGRRLVVLLGMPEAKARRLRLSRLYGQRLADDIIATLDELGESPPLAPYVTRENWAARARAAAMRLEMLAGLTHRSFNVVYRYSRWPDPQGRCPPDEWLEQVAAILATWQPAGEAPEATA